LGKKQSGAGGLIQKRRPDGEHRHQSTGTNEPRQVSKYREEGIT